MDLTNLTKLTSVRNRVPVRVTNGDGSISEFALIEFDGDVRDDYIAKLRTRLGDSKSNVPRNTKGMFSELICLCLYPAKLKENDDGEWEVVSVEDEPVDRDTVHAWPSSTQESLFDAAHEINKLGRGVVQEAKND